MGNEVVDQVVAGALQSYERAGGDLSLEPEMQHLVRGSAPTRTPLFQRHLGAAHDSVPPSYVKEMARPPQAASMRSSSKSTSCTQECHIVYFSDVCDLDFSTLHGREGNAAQLAALIKEIKTGLHPHVPLIIFGGNFAGPSPMSSVTHGGHMIEALNALGVHFGSFGPRDLDYGYATLLNRLGGVDDDLCVEGGFARWSRTGTTWLTSNVSDQQGRPFAHPFGRREALMTVNGVLVGLLGVLDSEQLSAAGEELKSEDVVEACSRSARHLRVCGASLVFCIAHCSFETERLLAESVPEIDMILGALSDRGWRGVTHIKGTVHDEGEPPSFDVNCRRVDDYHEPDTDMVQVMSNWQMFLRAQRPQLVAGCWSPCGLSKEPSVASLQSWVCDVVCEELGAQLALLAGGTFMYGPGEDVIGADGSITLGDLLDALPVRSCTLAVVWLSGEQILRSLGMGCCGLPCEDGLLFCSSRLSYGVSWSTPAEPASVCNVLFDSLPLDPGCMYTVAITSEMGQGNFGCTRMSREVATRMLDEQHGPSILDVVLRWSSLHQGDCIAPCCGRIRGL